MTPPWFRVRVPPHSVFGVSSQRHKRSLANVAKLPGWLVSCLFIFFLAGVYGSILTTFAELYSIFAHDSKASTLLELNCTWFMYECLGLSGGINTLFCPCLVIVIILALRRCFAGECIPFLRSVQVTIKDKSSTSTYITQQLVFQYFLRSRASAHQK